MYTYSTYLLKYTVLVYFYTYEATERNPYEATERNPYEATERNHYEATESNPYKTTERNHYEAKERNPCEVTERSPSMLIPCKGLSQQWLRLRITTYVLTIVIHSPIYLN